ncbi:MAG: alanyl-tRNA editing protein [Clostridiales bacterium]|nr:alanyl-tRNA editing protein [Clostridiales bacterium]
MTERLFDADSHLKTFTAIVRTCRPDKNSYEIILDKTAFFPAGGGQPCDVGKLGNAVVSDVFDRGPEIVHISDSPLTEGTEVYGELDWERRLRLMQNHSGEHIVSGLVHRLYGFDNVGFHMGADAVTIDFNGELTADDIRRVEYRANLAVAENVRVTSGYPSPQELAFLNYRSKLELTENVRLVNIDGFDLCACCAPHVNRTGEIGLIKLLGFMRHRGGVRISMLAGLDALDDYTAKSENAAAASVMLSAPQSDIANAIRRVLGELEDANTQINELKKRIVALKAASLKPSEGNICIFEKDMDPVSLRELVNAGMELCKGMCAAFSGEDGNRKYIIGSRTTDLKALAGDINKAINGRGGGSSDMIQGSCSAPVSVIEDYFLR